MKCLCMNSSYRFFSSVSLTPYCVHPGVGHLQHDDRTGLRPTEFRGLAANFIVFPNLLALFEGLTAFLGAENSRARDHVSACM